MNWIGAYYLIKSRFDHELVMSITHLSCLCIGIGSNLFYMLPKCLISWHGQSTFNSNKFATRLKRHASPHTELLELMIWPPPYILASVVSGSSCSTPISGSSGGRGEMDYPSPNFVRPSLVNLEDNNLGVSIDEGQRLTIRLHYNPVMDEWVT